MVQAGSRSGANVRRLKGWVTMPDTFPKGTELTKVFAWICTIWIFVFFGANSGQGCQFKSHLDNISSVLGCMCNPFNQ